MNWIRERFQNVSSKAWIVGGLSAAFLLVAAATLFWVRTAPQSPQSVEEKWNVAIRQLGLEPVYPPEEDIEVGDVFAIVSYDSLPENGVIDSPLANHAVRLWRKNLTAEVEENYRNTYVFSDLFSEGVKTRLLQANDRTTELSPSDESVFRLREHRNSLPIVTFPKFNISDNRSAHFGVLSGILNGLHVTAESNSDTKTEVSITKTETYGVPYLVAENALINFCEDEFPSACTDDAIRKVLSTRIGPQIFDIGLDRKTSKPRYRMSVEIGLINRVFLTQDIRTHLVRSAGDRVLAKIGSHADRSRSGLSNKQTKEGKVDQDVAASEIGASAIQTGVEESGAAEDATELAVSFDGSTLNRPVVFGFESVRYVPKAIPITGLATK